MRRRLVGLRQSVGWLVGRLVLASLAVGRASAEPLGPRPVALDAAVWEMPRELLASGEAVTADELLRRLRSDRGCAGVPPRRHLACAAAGALGRMGQPLPRAVAALEETVTAAHRPACVTRAAVEALGSWEGPAARRALGRMYAVARRRLEWEGSADVDLVRRMAEVLARRP